MEFGGGAFNALEERHRSREETLDLSDGAALDDPRVDARTIDGLSVDAALVDEPHVECVARVWTRLNELYDFRLREPLQKRLKGEEKRGRDTQCRHEWERVSFSRERERERDLHTRTC